MAKPDAYESQYMASDGVMLRDKRVSPRSFQILSLIPTVIFALFTLGGLGSALFGGNPSPVPGLLMAAGSAVVTAFFVFSFLAFTVMRTVITQRELHIQCGFAGPRIAMDSITSVKVAEQRNRVRVGKRWEGDMWASDFLYAFGEYVEVVWTNAKGKPQRVRFTPTDPHGVAAAIQRARSAAADSAATTGPRIAPEDEAQGDAQAALDKAEELEQRTKR